LKSKKLLSTLLSFGLIMTAVAPGVMAKPVEKVEANYSIYHEVRANEDAIIEMLKREGKIKEGASQEEISKMLNEYLKVTDPANDKIKSNREKMKHERMIEKTRQYAINNGNTEKVLKGQERYAPQIGEVQEEGEYEGTVMEVDPLVVLMDFADYNHEDLTAAETANFYEDFSAEHYKNMMFREGTYKGPDGETDFITMRQYY
jgi:immune inhibitor A